MAMNDGGEDGAFAGDGAGHETLGGLEAGGHGSGV